MRLLIGFCSLWLLVSCASSGNTTKSDWTSVEIDNVKGVQLDHHKKLTLIVKYKPSGEVFRINTGDQDINANLLPVTLKKHWFSGKKLFIPQSKMIETWVINAQNNLVGYFHDGIKCQPDNDPICPGSATPPPPPPPPQLQLSVMLKGLSN